MVRVGLLQQQFDKSLDFFIGERTTMENVTDTRDRLVILGAYYHREERKKKIDKPRPNLTDPTLAQKLHQYHFTSHGGNHKIF